MLRYGALSAAAFMATCSSNGPTGGMGLVGQSAAADSTENLFLQELTSTCTATQVQDSFSVTNNDTAPIALSDITVKMWVDETTASSILAATSNGCVSNYGPGGSCDHSVGATKVTVAATPQACGANAANWEVDIRTNDHSPLNPGQTWTGFGVSLTLPKGKAFTPGASGWYSTCGASHFAPSANVAVYFQGNLVRASTGLPPACVAPTGKQVVGGATPPAIVAGTVPLVGPLDPSTSMLIGISLPVQGQGEAAAEQLVTALYDPTSDQHGAWLQPSDVGAMFGAPSSDYAQLVSYFQSFGLTVVQYSNSLHMTVTGTAGAIENALNVTLNQYRRPDGSIFYAPANDPSLNLTIPVAFISGLDSYAVPLPQDGSGKTFPGPNDGTGNCPEGGGGAISNTATGYMGSDFRNMYLGSPSYQGTGLRAAVVAFDAFDATVVPSTGGTSCAADTDCGTQLCIFNGTANVCSTTASDADRYYHASNPGTHSAITYSPSGTPKVQQFACNGAASIVAGGGEPEVAADISLINAVAPGASIDVYEYPSDRSLPLNPNLGSSAGFLAIMNTILEKNQDQVIVNSWIWQNATYNPTVANALLQAALQGMSFFQAAGDNGAYIASESFCTSDRTVASCTADNQCNQCTSGGICPATGLPCTGGVGGTCPLDPCIPAGVPEPIIDSPLMTVVAATLIQSAGTGCTIGGVAAPGGCATGANASCCGGTCNKTTGACDSADNAWQSVAATKKSSGGGYVQTYSARLGATYPTLPLPAYQVQANKNIDPTNTSRMIPDVSIVGDQLTTFFHEAGQYQSCNGGTSYAAALWGGVALLIDDANAHFTTPPQPRMGMANFALYNLSTYNFHDATPNYSASLYDVPINKGSNANPTGNGYSTKNGYDLVTGLGVPMPNILGAGSILPPQSCQSGSNLTLLVTNNSTTKNVIAYTPMGNWSPGSSAGVHYVVLENNTGAYPGTLPSSSTNVAASSGPLASTPIGIVNTCAADSSGAGNVVCTENNGNVWLINGTAPVGVINDGTSGTNPLSLATASEGFSGGGCSTCNVAVDPLSHKAFVSLGTPGPTAQIQVIDLNTAFGNAGTNPTMPVTATQTPLISLGTSESSEAIATDTTRGAVLSANELGNFQFINVNANPNATPPQPQVYNYNLGPYPNVIHNTPWEFDATAEDCSTGIAVIATEDFPPQLILVDLKKAAFDNATATWGTGTCSVSGNACATNTQCTNLCDTVSGKCIQTNTACTSDAQCVDTCSGTTCTLSHGTCGTSADCLGTCGNPYAGVGFQTFSELGGTIFGGVSVASDGSHFGIAATEFGGNKFVIFQLDSQGAPSVHNYVVVTMPPLPNSDTWTMGDDPHTLGIYTSPNNQKVYGVLQNNTFTGDLYLAVIDLDQLLNHTATDSPGSHTISSPPAGTIRFVGN